MGRLNKLLLKMEASRLRQHFERVEHVLRAQDVSHLSSVLRQARERHLDRLHAYATRGVFPRNHERPDYAPCFIDRDGRECAVAHLMIASGHSDAAHHIAGIANYAYIPQMKFPELDEWAAQMGLSREELALIQPGYWMSFTGEILTMAIATWTAGLVISAINAVQIARRRYGIVAPVIGFACVTVLLLLSVVCLYDAGEAYIVAAHADGYPGDLPLRDAGPFSLVALISLGLALLTGSLGYYRARAFYRARLKNRQRIVGDMENTTAEVTDS